jgi:hypothetical protein
MRRVTLLAGAATLATLLAIAAPVGRAHACSCAQLGAGQALEGADVAFVGVVAAARDPGAGEPQLSSIDPVVYTFAVEEVLKPSGDLPAAMEVSSARSGASCGQAFAVGERWRVFAYRDGARLSTGICSGNELMAQGVPVPSLPGGSPTPPPLGLVIALGAAALVAAISIWAFTRRSGAPSA